ncbi:S1C family serine protease [Haloactinomyces albus]|uniref:S1-C subfamily serine protease n=1 Tax=Haloactinomyces albus TaxID=1352928 RepID=A0AAE3ZBL1_9ACTN|nr:trypsin-like peptidase domain-containing protein [Haloactinomyces albus]MDR7300529.1 S1-C subfamily serine protease [Haloactinomyces albus]
MGVQHAPVSRRRPPRPVLAFLLITALTLAGCTNAPPPDSGTQAPGTGTSSPAPGSSLDGPVFGRIPEIVDRVRPSIVTVRTPKGVGSGVVYRSGGVIVTNRHVVARSQQQQAPVFDRVTIVFATGKQAQGRVVGADYPTDLAVIRVNRTGLNAAEFRTELPEVGELAVAIGSPLGFRESSTAGIISGLNRSFPAAQTQRPLINLIQTDAAISPGSSGGALVSGNAKVVGINELYLPPGQTGAVSIGFAIPSATVVDVVEQILRTGSAEHAVLGVAVVEVTPALADQLGLQRARGVLVQRVVEGSGAAEAGIRPGDVIVRLAGRRIDTVNTVYSVLRRHDPGDTVPVTIVRNGQERQLRITLTQR